jgi:hypothetical protein
MTVPCDQAKSQFGADSIGNSIPPSMRPLSMGIVSKLHQHSDRYLRAQLGLTHGETRESLVSFLETTRGTKENRILYPIPRNRISR